MNKKLLILGLIVIIATGFYMNGLLAHDNVITTAAGTNVTVPYKHFDLQSNNSAEVFGDEFQDEFTYVIAFNATENPEMYQELCNIICQGQRYKDEDTGVVFYQDVSKKLVNDYTFHGHNLKIANDYFNGGIMLNNETGECIIVVSTITSDVIDILKSIEWGNKTVKTNNTVNTTATVEEPVYEDTTTETTNVDNTADKKTYDNADKKTYDNADGIGLSDVEYSKQHQKEIDAYQKGLEDAGYFDEEDESVSDDPSQLTD